MTETQPLGPVGQQLQDRLAVAFAPLDLRVEDQSHRHRGHAGWRPEGETHFHVSLTSAAFAGATRVERQRQVHHVLAHELADRVHALSLDLRAPDEA